MQRLKMGNYRHHGWFALPVLQVSRCFQPLSATLTYVCGRVGVGGSIRDLLAGNRDMVARNLLRGTNDQGKEKSILAMYGDLSFTEGANFKREQFKREHFRLLQPGANVARGEAQLCSSSNMFLEPAAAVYINK